MGYEQCSAKAHAQAGGAFKQAAQLIGVDEIERLDKVADGPVGANQIKLNPVDIQTRLVGHLAAIGPAAHAKVEADRVAIDEDCLGTEHGAELAGAAELLKQGFSDGGKSSGHG
jgi:hypothetical protein